MSRNLHLRKGKSSASGGADSTPDSPMRRNWSWVIEVLVAESNRHNPLHHQRVHRRLDRLRTAPILKAGSDQLGQRQGAIDSAQQQGPGIGVDAPAVGTDRNPVPINVPRALASSDTLCRIASTMRSSTVLLAALAAATWSLLAGCAPERRYEAALAALALLAAVARTPGPLALRAECPLRPCVQGGTAPPSAVGDAARTVTLAQLGEPDGGLRSARDNRQEDTRMPIRSAGCRTR